MENVIERKNRGALPLSEQPLNEQPETEFDGQLDMPDSDDYSVPEVPDKPIAHVRAPGVHRNASRIVMSIAALCGAAAGAVIFFKRGADASLLNTRGTFGGIFVSRMLLGSGFLLVEYILGFFAIGDMLVWLLPLCFGMGLGMRITAAANWQLLPSAVIALSAVSFAAAASADFSSLLMRLSSGGTVYLESSPRKSYAFKFLGYLIVMTASALLEGLLVMYAL